jgi:hypothetical protein
LRSAAEPRRPQPTIGSSILPPLHLQGISSKSLARRLCRPDWATPTPWFCSTNPGRSGLPRARCSKFCSESAASPPLPIGADLRCSERSCGICDCVSDIPCHRSKAAFYLSPARIIIHNHGNLSVALMAMHPPLAGAPPTTPSRRFRPLAGPRWNRRSRTHSCLSVRRSRWTIVTRSGRWWSIRLDKVGTIEGHNLRKTRSKEFRNMCPASGSR